MMRGLYTLWLLTAAIFCQAAQYDIELGPSDIWRYNNVAFESSSSPMVPVTLFAAQNASTTRDDPDLIDGSSNEARILTGGVPLAAIDSVMAAQLFGARRFVADHDGTVHVHVIVRDYQTQYRRLNTHRMPKIMANAQAFVALPKMADKTPFAQLQIQFVFRDQLSQQTDVLDIHAALAPCERLNGAQWQAVATPDTEFWQNYSSTAIGQTVLASINYATEWFYQHYSANSIGGYVEARRGERLQLSLTAPDVRVGDTLALWHKDHRRVIGHLRVSALAPDHSIALPTDIHPASIAIGDRLQVSRTPPAPAVFLPPPPLVNCERDKNAKAGDNQTTITE